MTLESFWVFADFQTMSLFHSSKCFISLTVCFKNSMDYLMSRLTMLLPFWTFAVPDPRQSDLGCYSQRV